MYNRYLQVFWPNKTAFIDSKCNVKLGASPLERYTKGLILVELPLATRHSGVVNYVYDVSVCISLAEWALFYVKNKKLPSPVFQFRYAILIKVIVVFSTDAFRRNSSAARAGRRWNTTETKSWKASIIACRSRGQDSIRILSTWSSRTSFSPSVPTTFTDTRTARREKAPTRRLW